MKDILPNREAARNETGNKLLCYFEITRIAQKRELLKNETNERAPSRLSAPRWIIQDSRRLMNQSERT